MAAEGKIVNADQNVLRGKKVNVDWLKPAHDVDEISAIDYLKGMNGKQILLQSMTGVTQAGDGNAKDEKEVEAIVWGPFTVRVYTADSVKYRLCSRELQYQRAWACYGAVCLRLEAPAPPSSPSSVNSTTTRGSGGSDSDSRGSSGASGRSDHRYLAHQVHTANMIEEDGTNTDSCKRVIAVKLAEASESQSKISLKFIGWDLSNDHVGMKTDGTPVTMWDSYRGGVDPMYQWKLVEEVTPEPTAEPTPEPTIEPTPVPPTAVPLTSAPPTPSPDDGGHAASSAHTGATLPIGAIIGIVAGILLLLAGILVVTMWVRRIKKNKVGKSGSTRLVVNTAAVPLEPLLPLTADNDQSAEEETDDHAAEAVVTRRGDGGAGAVVEVEAEATAMDDL